MKHLYLYCLALLPIMTSAQNKISYSYDAAGNRVKREIVMAMAKRQAFSSETQPFTDKLLDHNVKIYPNPTEGVLKVNITGLRDDDNCTLGVYTIQGTQVLNSNIKEDTYEINITNQPAGIYMLRITINTKSTTWKIIKK